MEQKKLFMKFKQFTQDPNNRKKYGPYLLAYLALASAIYLTRREWSELISA